MNHKKLDANKWYENNYAQINASANPNSLVFKYLHKSIEKNFKSNEGFEILEIGANVGEHVNFVAKNFKSYTLSDIRQTKLLNHGDAKIKFRTADVENLPFEDSTFDRIISTCVFHHLNDPARGLEEIRRVVRVGGYISILLPNDPGLMYSALRRLTTLRKARQHGLLDEAQLIHALEHKNHYLSIRTLVKRVFKNDVLQLNFKPFWIPSYNFNAITVITIRRLI